MIEVEEKKHAVLSPSSWATWGNCPGSVVLAEGIHVPPSEYADEGTAAHSLLERCLNENSNPETYIGETITVGTRSFTVNQEMADAINSSVEVIASYMDDGAVLQTEQTVPLTFMTGEKDAEGTCDNAIIRDHGKHLVIIDFKYGKGVMVYASELLPTEGAKRPNGQLAMYALGWLQKNGLIYEDIEKVTLVVLQPRLEWVDDYELTVEQLREFESVVRDAAGAVEMEKLEYLSGGADLTLVVGEKQCKFCNAKAICPALKTSVSTALATVAEPSKLEDFENLSLPKQASSISVSDTASNEKLAEFFRAIPLIEAAVDAVQEEIKRRLFDGQEIEGLYLGQGRKGPRSWINAEAALKEMTKSGRLKVAEATEKVPISPTAAEKLLKDKKPKAWEALKPFIKQSEGGAKVCREGVDSNKPYSIASPVEAFADIDAPKITVSKACETGNGMYVQASDGQSVTMTSKQCTGKTMKLARVGEPIGPLLEALKPAEPHDEPIDAPLPTTTDAAMSALMD